MRIQVIVASHKKYEMPKDTMYLPLHVGAKGKESIGFERDDTGDNISDKNPGFCELTGLYWAWKNVQADAVGLAHYRRHFGKRRDMLLDSKTAEKLLEKSDAILPKKRNYYIEDLYSHYVHTLQSEPLDKTGEIIKEKYPEYYPEYERLSKRKSAHMFNMFIMKKEQFNEYCEWLFDILFELERRMDKTEYDAFQSRFYGRVSELLLDIWVNTNNVSYSEYPFVYMENIDYKKKIKAFLSAKFTGKKYDKSF